VIIEVIMLSLLCLVVGVIVGVAASVEVKNLVAKAKAALEAKLNPPAPPVV
jgi:hypothetical protein